jgi:hypothetical protein
MLHGVALLFAQVGLAAVQGGAAGAVSPVPTPCPPAEPSTLRAASPAPCPSATPSLKEIGRVTAVGRKADLVGKAGTASSCTIGQDQIEAQPLLRPGELLEAIPGLVISQHSGEGKANQYYLRGFQLDHGTDLAAFVIGEPVNLPTHAHGQGYSDINWLIPELVSFVQFKKGPYYADEGDFSTAGAYNLFYRNIIPTTTELGIGQYGYARALFLGAPKVGSGNLMYGFELYHDDGSFVMPDNYRKFNGVLRYSRSDATTDFNVTALGYNGDFSSTDQIPLRLVDAGELNRLGFIDPTDGGSTHRYSLSTQFEKHSGNAVTRFSAYGIDYYLNLFSNFTYFNDNAADYYNVTGNPLTCNPRFTTCAPCSATSAGNPCPAGSYHVNTYTPYCPSDAHPPGTTVTASGRLKPGPFAFGCGDQREQEDQRFVSGFNLSRAWQSPRAETTLGFGLRNDNIPTVGLFLTNDRIRYPNGTLSDDHAVERDFFSYLQALVHVTPRLRVAPGLRAEFYNFDVHAPAAPNSGSTSAALLLPKMTVAYQASPYSDLYVNFGESYHSNDARGTTLALDPQTHAPFDPTGAPVQRVSPLVRASGEEVGYRFTNRKLNSTVALWRLNIQSELVFQGDGGTTSANAPTVRQGVEFANLFTPTNWLTINADYATSTARFTSDTDHLGTGVPESLAGVASLGATIVEPFYEATLQARYFGPRVLTQDGRAVSAESMLLNAQVTVKSRGGYRLTLDIFNLLGANANDIEYYYGSWTPLDAANPAYRNDPAINPTLGGGGVNDYHFHPSEQRTLRLTLSRRT